MTSKYEPSLARRSIRLRAFDYTSAGYYFVTTNVVSHAPALGVVDSDGCRLTAAGELVQAAWTALPDRFEYMSTDAFSVQPDHVHAIVVLNAGATASLGTVMRAFKSISARSVNEDLGRHGQRLWQRNFYERVIRNERELVKVRNYVRFNWMKSLEHSGGPEV